MLFPVVAGRETAKGKKSRVRTFALMIYCPKCDADAIAAGEFRSKKGSRHSPAHLFSQQ